MQIFLENKEFHFSGPDLPMLIHGAHKAGASLFSVTVAAQLFLSGKKLFFFTAYPMAKEEFMKQIAGSGREKDIFYLEWEEDITKAFKFDAVIVKSGDSALCLKAFQAIPDIEERIIFIKNVEIILTKELFVAVKGHDKLIMSGDLDGVDFVREITTLKFKNKILFSKSVADLGVEVSKLEKYVGFMVGREKGLIALSDKEG